MGRWVSSLRAASLASYRCTLASRDSPEFWWVLLYEPVHVKAVVKLDGAKKKSEAQVGL